MIPSQDPELCRRYRRDVSIVEGAPEAVLRPRDVADVQLAVADCAARGVAVLAVGGQTSTTGASVPVGGGLVVDMTTLGQRDSPDASHVPGPAFIAATGLERACVVVDPGVNLQFLSEFLHGQDCELPVDPTSAATCTVGGAVATNASGPASFRHGAMARWVRSVTFVDGVGQLRTVDRPRVTKSAMGPAALQDPVQWLVGSEGTLGIITSVTLDVRRRPEAIVAAFVGVDSVAGMLQIVATLQAERAAPEGHATLRAVEWLDRACCQLIAPHAEGLRVPEGQGGGLLLVVEGRHADALATLDRLLHQASRLGADVARAQVLINTAQHRRFAALRHHVPDTLNRRGRAFQDADGGGKLSTDWSAPIGALDALFAEDHEALNAIDGVDVFRFGHIGDGHPHLNLVCRDGAARAEASSLLVEQLGRVIAAGGVAVSEHGIGKLKRDMAAPHAPAGARPAWLGLKRWLDPAGILARGNLFATD